MSRINFTPGPSQLYPGVKEWIAEALEREIPSLSHRSSEYVEIHKNTVSQLRVLLDVPKNYQLFFLSSATEGMERSIQNCVKKHSHHLVNGIFSKRFAEISAALGKKVTTTEATHGKAFKPADLKVPKSAELIGMVQNETSTGAQLPSETIKKAREKYPDKLIALDVVSSAPLSEVDLNDLDIMFFSVQKCFGLPAGQGVIIVSPEAMKKANELEEAGISTGSYHSFKNLEKLAAKNHTPETPNVLNIFLLGKVAEDMNKKGKDALVEEARRKHKILHDAIDSHPTLDHFVKDSQYKSLTVMTIETNGPSSRFIESLKDLGLVVGSGYGSDYKHIQLRIANFPATSEEHIIQLSEHLGKID